MPQDHEILHQIKEGLTKDERTAELHQIHLKVVDGVVFLDGEVPTKEAIAAVSEITNAVEGVRFVQDRLKITRPPAHPGRHEWRHPEEGRF